LLVRRWRSIRESAGGWGFVRRKKGTPFAVAIMGTRRGPEVFANGRTLRTARSGGRQPSLSFGGDIGAGHTLGRGVRVALLES
jgi:cytochrome P450